MRVLVIGASGMLGQDVVREAPRAYEILRPTRAELDITDEAAVYATIGAIKPDIIINCAAYTAVDRAELQPDAAEAVNAVAPGIIGRATAAHKLPRAPLVIHFSTDYVFDGTAVRPYREDDPTRALGVYGRTKLAGEAALRASDADHVVLRTSWLYGLGGRSFPRTMWERARAVQATRVVNDQRGRPTYTRDLAAGTWRVVEAWQSGGEETVTRESMGPWRRILHVSNAGDAVTWYGIAERTFQRAKQPTLVSPCTTTEYPTLARRPAWSVLDTTAFDQLAGPLPHWRDALDRFLDALEAA